MGATWRIRLNDPCSVVMRAVAIITSCIVACYYALPYGRGHKAMLSVRLSVCLSVPFSDYVAFSRWRYARVAVSNAFVGGQHGRLCYERGWTYRFAARYFAIGCLHDFLIPVVHMRY